jgi:titin
VGEGPRSAERVAIPGVPAGAPTLVSAVPGDSRVTLSWTAPAAGGPVSGYRVYRRLEGGEWTALATVAAVTTYVDTGLPNGSTAFYRVTALATAGEGPPSNVLTATAATTPDPPQFESVSAGDRSVRLSWYEPWSGGSEITEYRVYRNRQDGRDPELVYAGLETSFLDTGLSNGVWYAYRLTAVNAVGEGAPSDLWAGFTVGPPLPPEWLDAVPGPGTVTLTWQDHTFDGEDPSGGSPITAYRIYRGVGDAAKTLLASIDARELETSGFTYTDTRLDEGVDYRYEMTAVNEIGESAHSSELQAFALEVPSGRPYAHIWRTDPRPAVPVVPLDTRRPPPLHAG